MEKQKRSHKKLWITLTAIVVILAILVFLVLGMLRGFEPGEGLYNRMMAKEPGNSVTYDFDKVERLEGNPLEGKHLCVLGSSVTSILPEMVRSAMGIAIYGMFIAIIIPPARSSRPVLYTVLLAAAVSCLFYYTPVLSLLSRGWVIILCAVGVSAFMAWRFPVKQTDESEAKEDAADA